MQTDVHLVHHHQSGEENRPSQEFYQKIREQPAVISQFSRPRALNVYRRCKSQVKLEPVKTNFEQIAKEIEKKLKSPEK